VSDDEDVAWCLPPGPRLPEREAVSAAAADLRRAGFAIDTGELALHLAPPRGPVAEVTIAGQRYLVQPREDGQPGLRLVRPVEWPELPEREHR
jgi:hypothetical protein